jgi:hypothetical protein
VKEPLIRYRPERDPKPKSRTDWARLKRMSDEEIERAALDDPDAQPLPMRSRLAAFGRER